MKHVNLTTYDDREISPSPRYRVQLNKGCFRFVHDDTNDQSENWRERLYRDPRPVGMRRAKQRR